MIIYGVDSGFYNIGFCKLVVGGEINQLNFYYENLNFLSKEKDFVKVIKTLSKVLRRYRDGDVYFIEEIAFVPFRSRKVQAKVWMSIALLLSVVKKDAKCYFISSTTTKKRKDLAEKVKKYKIEELLENKEGKEHLIDAFKVLYVGLEKERLVQVDRILEEFSF